MLLLLPAPSTLSSPSRRHRRHHQRPQRYRNHFVLLLLSAPIFWLFRLLSSFDAAIVYKCSWCSLGINFISNDFIIIIFIFSLYELRSPWQPIHSFRCKKSPQMNIWHSLLFRMGISDCDAAYKTWQEILSATIEIKPFKRYYSEERKKKMKKKTRAYSNFGIPSEIV